uniref:Uncharacterized protein n=1 Tax=Rhizophora mucronata TaxID=61149 RepID=A0A2P2NKM0_RHIMU
MSKLQSYLLLIHVCFTFAYHIQYLKGKDQRRRHSYEEYN